MGGYLRKFFVSQTPELTAKADTVIDLDAMVIQDSWSTELRMLWDLGGAAAKLTHHNNRQTYEFNVSGGCNVVDMNAAAREAQLDWVSVH